MKTSSKPMSILREKIQYLASRKRLDCEEERKNNVINQARKMIAEYIEEISNLEIDEIV